MEYCVGFIFNPTMTEVLLLKMEKFYTDRLNGVGGKINPGEHPMVAMYRETFEETSIEMEDVRFIDLVKLDFPNDTKLWVFSGTVHQRWWKQFAKEYPKRGCEGMLDWYYVDDMVNVNNNNLAGEGNVPWFIHYALVISGKRKG